MSNRYAELDVNVFPASYAEARQRWLQQVAALDCRKQLQAFPCPGLGPDGEALVTDSVWLGDTDAANVVVVLGATHGIEGFVGSAGQIDLLASLSAGRVDIPPASAILLVHALTPWGYAWLRRCDGDGVDLNRNAVDFSRPMPENADYNRLREAIFQRDAEQRRQAFADYASQYGRQALEQGISGGQYADPAGPFYGGRAPAHGRLVCEELIRRYGLDRRRLAVIDLHSGLGPYGYGEIICDHDPDSPGAAVARDWYGDSVTLPLAGTSSSVPKLGLLDYLWHAAMTPQSCYVTLEFGTFSTDCLFETLLRDHLVWAESGNSAERQAHSQLMLAHFCPAASDWREMVLCRIRQVIAQALQGVSA
ncbi:DUF2817 domain-containing protein [Methylomonas koyamae]|uniref:DUF2817 domain-containing protein n=1 Tax=Methylomonas koyamae TaxID=702114 RepID=UPI002872E27E|nr:DUF2817 domain-containing protein [Methylomonas koyamae]WNB77919.1 DUF2817 domain-containing protein [Methylomonas koyamae]